jgi:hypothetical protein
MRFAMSFFAMSLFVSRFHDAAVSSEAWRRTLEALTEAIGAAGAALIISNKSTGNVDEAYFSGLSAEFKPDYVRHTQLWIPTRRCSMEAGRNSRSVFRTRCCGRASGTTTSY